MKKRNSLIIIALVLILAISFLAKPDIKLDHSLKNQDSYIIEFKTPPSIENLDQIQKEHQLFIELLIHSTKLDRKTANFSIDRDIKHFYKVFNGVAIKKSLSDKELTHLLKEDFVKEIHLNYKAKAFMNDTLKIINGTNIHFESNLTGENVTISILDSGVDYTHADFGSCTTEEFTDNNCSNFLYSYDYVNSDSDAMDDHGHGTHITGIIASNSTNITSIAPKANLYIYKVLNSSAGGETSNIIAAIERSLDPNNDFNYSDKADILCLSFGTEGSPEDALSIAVNNAVDSGMLVVAPVGENSNSRTIACPACALKSLAVGANYKYKQATLFSEIISLNDSNKKLHANPSGNSDTTSSEGITAEILDAGTGSFSDFISQDFVDKIALVSEELDYDTQYNNALAVGALALIIYDDEEVNSSISFSSQTSIPVVKLPLSTGNYLKNKISQQETHLNLIVNSRYVEVFGMTSKGPSYSYNKPDITAPGYEICSTAYTFISGYTKCIDSTHISMSGTSMANAVVAASAALIKQAHPDWTPLQIKAAIKSTATDLDEDKNLQGAGRINLYAVVNLTFAPPIAMIKKTSNTEFRND
jgi:minor extracellular serine protease Vpr